MKHLLKLMLRKLIKIIVNIQHPDVFNKGTATHVVTTVLYGAKAFSLLTEKLKLDCVPYLTGKLGGIYEPAIQSFQQQV